MEDSANDLIDFVISLIDKKFLEDQMRVNVEEILRNVFIGRF